MKNDYPELNAKIEKAINFFVEDLGSIRAGRASTTVLNRISVDYYGTMTPIPQVAAVATPDARTITIQPWDASLIKEIEKMKTEGLLLQHGDKLRLSKKGTDVANYVMSHFILDK